MLRSPQLSSPCSTWRDANDSLKSPIESCFRGITEPRGQLSDVHIFLSKDRESGIHTPAGHVVHNGFTERLGKTLGE